LKTTTKNSYKPVARLKKSGKWSNELKSLAIVIILLCLAILSGCSTTTTNKIKDNCLRTVETWGDVTDCAIKLDKLQ